MHNGIKIESIHLSDGSTYTPEKGKPPVCPCESCIERNIASCGLCNHGLGICYKYMDYELMLGTYRRTVFD